MTAPIETDAVVVGAGPAGLFSVFQLGLANIRCHVIDAQPAAGGQCTAFYAEKPIFDIPGFTRITGQELTQRLVEQVKPFAPQWHFGSRVINVALQDDGRLLVRTDGEASLLARVVVLAAGAGALVQKPGGPGISASPIPAQDWGIAMQDGGAVVDMVRFVTSQPGIFAVGDGCSYAGKLAYIASAFHEAAMMAQAAFLLCHGSGLEDARRSGVQYTSTSSNLQRRLGVQ